MAELQPLMPVERQRALSPTATFVAGLTLGLVVLDASSSNLAGGLVVLALGAGYCVFSVCRNLLAWHGEGFARRLNPTRIAQLESELGLPVAMLRECWNCHKSLAAGAKYCTYCGRTAQKPTAKVCPACLTRNPADGAFCIECSQPLVETL